MPLAVQNKSGRCFAHRNLPDFASLSSTAPSNTAAVSSIRLSAQQSDDTEPKVDLEAYRQRYMAMEAQHKWRLSTGKIVEDALYQIGMACQHESLVHQFILDPFSKELERVFNDVELHEIRTSNTKPLPLMPTALRDYIATFNKATASEIRDAIDAPQPWQRQYDLKSHGDYDWARSSVYQMIREYEAGSFDRPHQESWYLMHVWRFVDSAFDGVPEAEAVRGEAASHASSARKNKDRLPQDRKRIGRKCDIIIRSADCNHSTFKEYGAGETGPIVDMDGQKMRKEGGIKLPKVMRDMFNSLQSKIDHAKLGELQIIGYLHYGLSCSLLLMDSPASSYVTRLTRYPPHSPRWIATSVRNFQEFGRIWCYFFVCPCHGVESQRSCQSHGRACRAQCRRKRP
ncbi:hypothetical protein BC940DRAFT_292689 [Gongronella butleri]|nr:hypothetical protein BC940DRAFT_292689 [Gongronella butleri]